MLSAPTSPTRYVQVPTAPGRLYDALGTPAGRRTGHRASATYLALRLAGEASPGRCPKGPGDWQAWTQGRVWPFAVTAWAKDHALSYRRARKGLQTCSTAGLLSFELRASGRPEPGHVEVARDRIVHDRGQPEERFVQVSLPVLDAIAAEHGLDWLATALLIELLIRADQFTWQWSGTLTAFGPSIGVGARSLRRALRRLESAGLVDELAITTGVGTSLRLAAGPGLVVGTFPRHSAPERPPAPQAPPGGAPTPPAPPKRHERRQAERDERHNGPGAQLAGRLLAHHHLNMRPSAALVVALEEALASGATSGHVLEMLAARGGLAGAKDPMAVLVVRARQVGDELGAQAAADAERRATLDQAQAAENAEWDARQAECTAGTEESRWLAQQLCDKHLEGLRDVIGSSLDHVSPLALDLATRARLRAEVGLEPELGAVEAIANAVSRVLAGGTAPGRPGGALPRCRDGPTLAERFRDLT